MLIFGDDSLDLVVMGCEETAVFGGESGMALEFGFEMSQIPDTIVHAFGIVVDESDFFGRVELGKRSDAIANEETEILVLFAAHIGVEEFGMRWIVEGGHEVGVDVIHGLAF